MFLFIIRKNIDIDNYKKKPIVPFSTGVLDFFSQLLLRKKYPVDFLVLTILNYQLEQIFFHKLFADINIKILFYG